MTIFGKILLGLILATAAVLIVKGAGHKEVAIQPTDSTQQTSGENTTTPSAETSGVFNGSVQDLLARGGDTKCTFTHETEVDKSTGTVYISQKKMRGDFNSVVTVGTTTTTVESHMIMDNGFAYTWSSMMPQGLKIKVDPTAQPNTTNTQNFDPSQKLDYTCESWTPDLTLFSLPTTITFTEVKS